jgi:glycosyltransferase involved in cell wall biosynthesis
MRRIAIVGQPWEKVAPDTGSSISIIACELARCLANDWRVSIYGRRWRGQKRCEISSETIEFERLFVFRKHQKILETIFSVLACWKKTRFNYMFSYFYHFSYFLRVAFSIRASRYDIVLVINFVQCAAIIKLLNPSAIVCLRMGCEWLTQFASAASERRLRTIDLIIGVSEYITESIRTHFPDVAARCHTVRNGVDTARFCPLPGQNEGSQRLLFLARVSPEKGAHVLIQAFKILAEIRPALQLDIVGPAGLLPYIYLAPDRNDQAIASLEPFYGTRFSDILRRQFILRERSYFGDLAAEAAGDERIVFHGSVSQTETISFYRQATMLVFPSVWNEPSGNPTVEAAACGLPIISTYSGGIPEYVDDGRTGILVPRGDARELARAISRVIDDPALARAMGEAGRQRVLERFTWEASARRLADLIESVSREAGSQSKYTQANPSQMPAPEMRETDLSP